jgi:four helix bundle protein
MKSVEQLDVFKLAHELALKIYRITIRFPREENLSLVSQMRRAASSVGMNLVEGSMRLSKREYRQFVGIARGSAAEVSYQLLLAEIWGISRKRITMTSVGLSENRTNAYSTSPIPGSLDITSTSHEHEHAFPTWC